MSTLKRMESTDRVVEIIIAILITLFCFSTLYPFLYCLAYSFSDSVSVTIKNVYLLPVDITLDNYRIVFRNSMIMPAFGISILRTLGGIVYTLFITGLASYAISKRYLPGNRIISILLVIPMYVNGGMIANYVNTYQLNLFNKFLVYILPGGFVTFYMLIMRTYFESLPPSLEESAKLDGASDLIIFFRIIFPLSLPIFATIALFVGVNQWNSWFDAMVYVPNKKLHPIQMILQGILMANSATTLKLQVERASSGHSKVSPEAIQMATLIVTTVPIVVIYPFLQKYFVKGMLIGAVKA